MLIAITGRAASRHIPFIPMLVVALVANATWSAQAAARDVAMVTDATAPCQINGQTDSGNCQVLQGLGSGARVELGTGGQITIVFLRSGLEYVLTKPISVVVRAEKLDSLKGQHPTARRAGGVSPGQQIRLPNSHTAAAIVMRGGSRRMRKVQLTSPRNTKVVTSRPEFLWEPLAPNVEYQFILRSDSGQTLLEQTVAATSLQLPNDVPLRPGVVYNWTVQPRQSNGQNLAGRANFELLDESSRIRLEELRKTIERSFSKQVLYAAALETAGAHDAARSQWHTLAKMRPSEPRIKAKATH